MIYLVSNQYAYCIYIDIYLPIIMYESKFWKSEYWMKIAGFYALLQIQLFVYIKKLDWCMPGGKL